MKHHTTWVRGTLLCHFFPTSPAQTQNAVWRRNRNAWARLLVEQLRARCLEEPLSKVPPVGALPMLPTYLMHRCAHGMALQKAPRLVLLLMDGIDRTSASGSCIAV